MKLTGTGPWALECSYDERSVPKNAGFWWHPGRPCSRAQCGACAAGLGKSWWTRDRSIAARMIEHATDDARASLEGTVAAVRQSRATGLEATIARQHVGEIAIAAPPGREYLPFQRVGIDYAWSHPRCILGDEMGLGKTIQALGVVNADPSVRHILVICPATLRLNWAREAERWLIEPHKIVVVEDDAPATPDLLTRCVVVVNYERARRPKCADALRAHPWGMVICDEAHRLKNPKSQQTKAIFGCERKGEDAVAGIAARAPRLLLLTGTPLVNRPIKLFPLLHACNPREFPSYWGFARRYAAAHQTRFGWDLSGASNLPELQERMRATCLVRRLKRDVLRDLPAKRRQIIELAQNGAAKAVEAEASAWARQEERLESLHEAADTAAAMADTAAYDAAVRQLADAGRVAFTEMAQVRHDTAVAKAPAVAEHVLELLDGGVDKVIVFAWHHDVIDAIKEAINGRFSGPDSAGIHKREHMDRQLASERDQERCHDSRARNDRAQSTQKAHVVVIDGRTPQDARQGIVDAFQSESGPRVFLGSITAAGVGLTLTAAHVVVFAELDWVPGNVTQAEDRAHRIGQTEPVLVQHLVLDGSLDARMAKILVAKQNVADRALDEIAKASTLRVPTIPRRTEARPATWPVATDEQRARALQAMRVLAGACDGAQSRDGAGFSRFDTEVGHRLAASERLTDGQVWLAEKLARKYRRQLDEPAPAPGLMPGLPSPMRESRRDRSAPTPRS